jgi:hypothetical protein
MNQTIPHIFDFPHYIPIYLGRQDFVVAYAAGKVVLHLGCVDQGMAEQKLRRGQYLHSRLQTVCAGLWGVDIDDPGISWMKAQGWQNLFSGNIEDLDKSSDLLSQKFDLLVLSEVIEHLDNPGRFLEAIRPFFQSHTELLITTPNAASLANLLSYLHGQETVHPDHNFWFSYHTLKNLLAKYSYRVVSTALYTQYNYSRPVLGRLFKPPLKPAIPQENRPTVDVSFPLHTDDKQRRRNPMGWLSANTKALTYGSLLRCNSFFADGLIMVVKPIGTEK